MYKVSIGRRMNGGDGIGSWETLYFEIKYPAQVILGTGMVPSVTIIDDDGKILIQHYGMEVQMGMWKMNK